MSRKTILHRRNYSKTTVASEAWRHSVLTARTSKLTFLTANFECETLNERVAGAFCSAASILMIEQISCERNVTPLANVCSHIFRYLLNIIPVGFYRDQKRQYTFTERFTLYSSLRSWLMIIVLLLLLLHYFQIDFSILSAVKTKASKQRQHLMNRGKVKCFNLPMYKAK